MIKAAPGDYMFVYGGDDATAPIDNYMKGSVNDTVFSGEGKYYKLTFNKQHDLNSLGFYYDNEDGTRMVNPAHKGYVRQAAYAASKHAMAGFTKTLAAEVYEQGIRVHLISPGGVFTNMAKVSRPDLTGEEMITAEDIAEIAAFLVLRRTNAVIDEIEVHRANKAPFA